MNIHTIRTSCIICENILNNQPLFEEKNMPITFSPIEDIYSINDYTCDLIWLKCNTCGCIQLKDLLDPSILYKSSHNQTYLTKTWKDHHDHFCQFITCEMSPSDTIVEVGGSDGYLRSLYLNNKDKDNNKNENYYICDYSSTGPYKIMFDIENIDSFKNCPDNTKTIIMSHTLEHLYNPRKAIQNCYTYGIDTIYISVPWMEELLKENSLSIIHIEHTFFLTKSHIKYIFESEGYTITNQMDFKTHSFFIKAVRTDKPLECKIPYLDSILFEKYMNNRSTMLKQHTFNKCSILVPGGHFSSILYQNIPKDQQKYIWFAIDNDVQKQNKRIYGTNCFMFSFESAKQKICDSINKLEIDEIDKIDIVFIGCPYQNELIEQFKTVCSSYLSYFNIVQLDFDSD